MNDDTLFPATRRAALARLDAIQPRAYAATRNHLGGAVTRLSPYLTHGVITLREVGQTLAGRHHLPVGHKLVSELGWRAYFHHVWQHTGDAIFESLHDGPLPEAAYARTLPDDIRQGRTGVPVIDRAVATLYRDGWLHNHARMWLASYIVHLRHVHWRVGADWLYGHLLDGDLASNHLSWQWVAGTGSHKPYLFNADNVARFAPAPWHSPGTVVDTDYETLDRMARTTRGVREDQTADGMKTTARVDGIADRTGRAGAAVRSRSFDTHPGMWQAEEPPLWHAPPTSASILTAPDPSTVAWRDVWLVHPWALHDTPPPATPVRPLRIGVCVAEFHARWGWSERRWRFMTEAMASHTDACWWGDAATLRQALASARSVRGLADPHWGNALDPVIQPVAPPALFPEVPGPCRSFSQYWSRVTKGSRTLADLLERTR